jgi:hypothetical protein
MAVAVAIVVAVEVAARNQRSRREVEYGTVARSLLEGSGSEGQPVVTIYRLPRSCKYRTGYSPRCLDKLEAVDRKDELKWWHLPKRKVASQQPFELPQNSHTLTRYSRRWQAFLCYVMRTSPEVFRKTRARPG